MFSIKPYIAIPNPKSKTSRKQQKTALAVCSMQIKFQQLCSCYQALTPPGWLQNYSRNTFYIQKNKNGRSDTPCKIKETLLIRELRPTLNDTVSSENFIVISFHLLYANLFLASVIVIVN